VFGAWIWWKYSQETSFPEEVALLKENNCVKTKDLKSLLPYIDFARLLKVKGRLEKSKF
jgi:hypothetical protein